jgi:quinoprotein glucose dehydrogenase
MPQPSDVKSEQAAETQPLPVKPPPFSQQELTEDLLTDRTPEAHQAVLERFRRSGPQSTPPSLQGTIFPTIAAPASNAPCAFAKKAGPACSPRGINAKYR